MFTSNCLRPDTLKQLLPFDMQQVWYTRDTVIPIVSIGRIGLYEMRRQ